MSELLRNMWDAFVLFLKNLFRRKDWRNKALLEIPSRNVTSYEWVHECLTKHLIDEAKSQKKPLYNKGWSGFFETQKKQDLINFFTLGRRCVIKRFNSEYSENENDGVYIDKNTVLTIGFSTENNASISVCTTDLQFFAVAENYLKAKLTKRSTNNMGKAHVLSTSFDGLITKELGMVAVPLNEKNYSEEAKTGIAEIVKDLKSPVPTGKLMIIEGEPGTGKTFLIKSLISEISNAFFVIIPPAMVAKIGDPSIIPVLLRLKSNDYDYMSDEEMIQAEKNEQTTQANPIVMIVEDGDECLVKRGMDNMGSISSILNLTSGILGDLLDIRIIVTTNAKQDDIDPAIYRDGRLSCHLNIGRLSPDEATVVYRRLMKDDTIEYMSDNKPVLLASVYKTAKENCGSTAEGDASTADNGLLAPTGPKSFGETTSKRKKIGFTANDKE
jgi:hypothetical protein